jgi:hypothetical protein
MATRLGNFELIRELGTGAWGKVYLARQTTLDRPVAVKTLLPHLAADPRARQRFIDEANNMARLSHPNIVQIIEVGEQDGTYFFAMTYVEGRTLADQMAQQPLPYAQAAELIAQVADALGHAHSRGVVHRDIKPGNILIDASGRPMITDFGISKVGEGSGLTMTGGTIGTPEFMSPEQAQGNPMDGRSDLYSLGVVLYYMTTGYVPFGGVTPVAVGLKHVSEAPRDPRALVPDYPPWLADLLARALAKQPYERFETGEQMAAALRAGAAGQAAAAVVPPAPLPLPTPVSQPAPHVATVPPVAAPRSSSRTTLIAVLVMAICFVIGIVGATAWLRLRPAPPAAVPVTTAPAVMGGAGGGGGASGVGQEAIVATVRKLHEAISRHDQAGAIACFVADADGTPPYGLDSSDAYTGLESSTPRDFRDTIQLGDAATVECTVIVQTADAYFSTPFAYKLTRSNGAWLIDSVSKLQDTQRTNGRYVTPS